MGNDAQPLLSIYIPTYRRREHAVRQVLAIAKEFDDGVDQADVEVLVSVNGDVDGTVEAVEAAAERHAASIRVTCQSRNQGASANIVRCISVCRGRFIWLLSDDDVIVPGSLNEILFCLQHCPGDLTLLLLSLSVEDGGGNRVLTPRFGDFRGIRPMNQNFVAGSGALATMSGLVVRRAHAVGPLTHRFGDNARRIAPLCLALDALLTGSGYQLGGHHVVYCDTRKSHWSKEWPAIHSASIPRVMARYFRLSEKDRVKRKALNGAVLQSRARDWQQVSKQYPLRPSIASDLTWLCFFPIVWRGVSSAPFRGLPSTVFRLFASRLIGHALGFVGSLRNRTQRQATDGSGLARQSASSAADRRMSDSSTEPLWSRR